jgi:hypothetical protein
MAVPRAPPKSSPTGIWVYDQGVAKGFAQGMTKAVLALLEARGIDVPQADQERICRCTDGATLDGWIRRAVSIGTAAELFDEPAS